MTKRGTQCQWKGPRCPNHAVGGGIVPSKLQNAIPTRQQIAEVRATLFRAMRDNQLEIVTRAYQFLIGQASGLSAADHARIEQWSSGRMS
jgi:hypothetical protein